VNHVYETPSLKGTGMYHGPLNFSFPATQFSAKDTFRYKIRHQFHLKRIFFLLSFALLGSVVEANETVTIATNYGDLKLVLLPHSAPNAVRHFEELVRAGIYTDQRFYRVIANNYIQGGIGYFEAEKKTRIAADKAPRHPHVRGSVGFAWEDLSDPNSGATEIYICVSDQFALDKAGFIAFAQVIDGWEVLDKMSGVPVRQKWLYWDMKKLKSEGNASDMKVPWHEPIKPIVIERIWIDEN
jgi:cyclophilin family peptidyl-prolyl cis-trans isomerase